jgi:hypothetical protein
MSYMNITAIDQTKEAGGWPWNNAARERGSVTRRIPQTRRLKVNQAKSSQIKVNQGESR